MAFKIRFWVPAVLVGSILLSCGKKGDPTFFTFVKPPPVANITAVHHENSLLLSWSYSPPQDMEELVKGFYIEKAAGDKDNNPAEFKNIAALPGSVNHYEDSDFIAGRTYFYKIRVYSIRNVISDPSPVIKIIPATLPPAPQGLSYDIKDDAVEIKWDRVPGKVKYNIYKSYKQDVFSGPPLNKGLLTESSFRDKLESGSNVFYVVRSVLDTATKDEGFSSVVLEVNPETFVPSRPGGLNYVYSPKGVVLMWNENPESWVKYYRVYRKRGPEGGYSVLGEAFAPVFRDMDPLMSRTLYYITAVGPARESAPSELLKVDRQPSEEGR
jgi:hypothetical protein